jgi:hypothetical protein
MKLSNTAIGLAAVGVGAGWLVARMVLARRGGETEPPSPERLIGQSPPSHHLSAQEAAEAFHSSKAQPS